MTRRRSNRRQPPEPWWADLDQEELLDVRLCDLELEIEGTALQERVDQLYRELDRAGVRFRPHVWLSTSWFSPDGVTGFAVPFFLAHRRLARLEHSFMFEVEGGTHDWCMRLMRHETGHAIDNAHRIHWRKSWRDTFGKFSTKYEVSYRPDPSSKKYVFNLDYWYSQSHPGEDWAECFAVWLHPGSRWRKRYAGWPALKKLEYVHELMGEIGDEPAKVVCRRRDESLPRLKMTLREYYERKQAMYGLGDPGAFDDYLRRLFSDDPGYRQRPAAAAFLRKNQHELRGRVAALTGQYRYVVDQALREMIASCRKLRLRLVRTEHESRLGAAILLSVLTMNFTGGRRQEFMR